MTDPSCLIEEAIEILNEQGWRVLADEVDSVRARLAAAESRLREYEDAPVVGHIRLIDTKLKAVLADCFIYHTDKDAELIIRPRGGKGE